MVKGNIIDRVNYRASMRSRSDRTERTNQQSARSRSLENILPFLENRITEGLVKEHANGKFSTLSAAEKLTIRFWRVSNCFRVIDSLFVKVSTNKKKEWLFIFDSITV